jgi:hypothetical protein
MSAGFVMRPGLVKDLLQGREPQGLSEHIIKMVKECRLFKMAKAELEKNGSAVRMDTGS